MAITRRIDLAPHQVDAVEHLHNGCILCGGVGSGKSRTALAYYYYKVCQDMRYPKDLYIITTAQKRDIGEWESEGHIFGLSSFEGLNGYPTKVVIDSWNNIGKYTNAIGAFFIFDEQRVSGKGAWVKSFLRITKKNQWILLTATPADKWIDYIPVFVANGFYKNRTHFLTEHVIFNSYTSYPKIDKYINVNKLIHFREMVLVRMSYTKPTEMHEINIPVSYDDKQYRSIFDTRWNPEADAPIENAAELCFLLRKVTNSSPDRVRILKEQMQTYNKLIIFYNFDFELDILRAAAKELDIYCAERNGHKHMPVPKCDRWVYLVQYASGSEGWNCVDTNVILFYSANYSYRTTVQASGRIDRMNTPYSDLYCIHLRSNSPIDEAIYRTYLNKEDFNVSAFVSKR